MSRIYRGEANLHALMQKGPGNECNCGEMRVITSGR